MKAKCFVSFPLVFRFMLLLASAMLSLAIVFVLLLRLSVTRNHDSELKNSIDLISKTLTESGIEELDFIELPYYMSYVVYDFNNRNVLSTNDALLPLLDSNGKCLVYFSENFFTDSDLFIRFKTENLTFKGKQLIIECAFDIENDSAAQMSRVLPLLAAMSFLPILLIAFIFSFFISRQTIFAFQKLQSDYDREKAFTSNVSHELKTPVSIIYGHANLLKRWGKDDPVQLSKSIDAILHETENMNTIITNLLDMSRLERGIIEVKKTRFYVTNLFVRLRDEFKILYPKMKFEIFDQDFIEIESDENKIHQIFTAALSNSVKFAGEDCCIKFIAKKTGNKVELSVIDNGKGFSENEMPFVFDRFFKGDSSHNRNVSGSGLGLSVSKALAEAIGASIKIGNAQNAGAIVMLTI